MLIPKESNSIGSVGPITPTGKTTSAPAPKSLVRPKSATGRLVSSRNLSSAPNASDVNAVHVDKDPPVMFKKELTSFKSSKQKGGGSSKSSKSTKAQVSLKSLVMKVRSRTTTKEKSKKSTQSVKKKQNQGRELVRKDSLALDADDSRLSIGFIPSSLANRTEVKEKRRTVQRLKGFAKHLDVSMMIFGFYFFILGMYDYFLPESHVIKEDVHHYYFFTFGLVALIPLVGSPFGFFAMRCRSQCLLFTSMFANFIFLLGGILYLFIYLLAIKPPGFNSEVLFLVQVGFLLAQSVMMSVVHCSLLRQMGVIRVVAKKHAAEKLEEEKESDSSNTTIQKSDDKTKN